MVAWGINFVKNFASWKNLPRIKPRISKDAKETRKSLAFCVLWENFQSKLLTLKASYDMIQAMKGVFKIMLTRPCVSCRNYTYSRPVPVLLRGGKA